MGANNTKVSKTPASKISRSVETVHRASTVDKAAIDTVDTRTRRKNTNIQRKPSQVAAIRYQTLTLKPVHKVVLRKAWQEIRRKGSTEPGESILNFLCLMSFEVSQQFGQSTPNDPMARQQDAPMMKIHSIAISSTIGDIIDNMDNAEPVAKTLFNMGVQHCMYSHSGEKKMAIFHPRFLDSLAEAAISSIMKLNERITKCPELHEAWTRVFLFLSGAMKDGYTYESRRMKRERAVDENNSIASSSLAVHESSAHFTQYQDDDDSMLEDVVIAVPEGFNPRNRRATIAPIEDPVVTSAVPLMHAKSSPSMSPDEFLTPSAELPS